MSNKGLTTVDHQDLTLAVSNWTKANEYFHKINKESLIHAEETFNNYTITKRFWLKLKHAEWFLFIPLITISRYMDDYIINCRESLGGDEYLKLCQYDNYFSKYLAEGVAAMECEKHSLYSGIHYLTPEQVRFVSVFKDLELKL